MMSRISSALPWVEGISYDLRIVLRGLRRDRGFTVAAIAMLALAIGLNVTAFTVLDAMLFRAFPVVRANARLVYLQERCASGLCGTSYLDFEDWRAQADAFQGMAFVNGKPITLRDGAGRPAQTFAALVSSNAFALLGVRPIVGRDFAATDEGAGARPVAILSYHFWASRYGRRASVLGSTVHANGAPVTIIGVMPEGFEFPEEHELWMPLEHTAAMERRGPGGGYMAFGRLRDGASVEEARAELRGINRRLEAEFPATNRGVTPRVDTWSQFFVGPDAPMIYGSLWAAAWCVLLVACANLANLTLARTMGRTREFSTRIALGAGQWRMMRSIFLESSMLAGVAGVFGWWIAEWSVHAWAVATYSRYQILDYRVDVGTFGYLAAISVGAAILISLAPIGRVLQLGVNGALKGDARGVTGGPRGKRLAAMLVAGQMALAIVLLSGAGVLVRSLWNVLNGRTGVREPERILIGSVRLPAETYASAASRLGYFERLETELKSISGIEDESLASTIPVGSVNVRTFEIEGLPSTPGDEKGAQFLDIAPDYFRVVGAARVLGRDFNDGDRMAALPVAIVNQSFADRFWPGESSIGKRVRATDGNSSGEWRTVVGVAPNIMQGDGTRQRFQPLIYVPVAQRPPALAFFLARTGVAPSAVAQAVRAGVQKLDPDVDLENLGDLKATFAFQGDRMDREHSEMGRHAAVAPIFAAMALLLAAIGLYAVIAYSVSQRTKEIGVRLAIGAASENIWRLILREGMTPVAAGLLVGLVASFGVNQILQSQLVGVSPRDVGTMLVAPLVLILVALTACQIPARRAMRVDPAVALRHE